MSKKDKKKIKKLKKRLDNLIKQYNEDSKAVMDIFNMHNDLFLNIINDEKELYQTDHYLIQRQRWMTDSIFMLSRGRILKEKCDQNCGNDTDS